MRHFFHFSFFIFFTLFPVISYASNHVSEYSLFGKSPLDGLPEILIQGRHTTLDKSHDLLETQVTTLKTEVAELQATLAEEGVSQKERELIHLLDEDSLRDENKHLAARVDALEKQLQDALKLTQEQAQKIHTLRGANHELLSDLLDTSEDAINYLLLYRKANSKKSEKKGGFSKKAAIQGDGNNRFAKTQRKGTRKARVRKHDPSSDE